jgi:DNA-binding NtrC family response regulator
VEPLAEWFLEACDKRFGLGAKVIHPDAMAWMNNYHWPGNVRELENLLYREYLLSEGPVIRMEPPKTMPAALEHRDTTSGELTFHAAKARAVEAFERNYLVGLLNQAGGNVSLAARLAGKERRSLGKLLKKHGLSGARLSHPLPEGRLSV